jgi:ATP-dependent Clp protease ATP-binding subunit ClpB
VDIQLAAVRRRLAERKIALELTLAAKELLAKEGYDPAYGARPLKRVIQRRLLDPLALAVLQGRFTEGETIVVDAHGDEIMFRVKEAVAAAA